jgi:hypothetical protein
VYDVDFHPLLGADEVDEFVYGSWPLLYILPLKVSGHVRLLLSFKPHISFILVFCSLFSGF